MLVLGIDPGLSRCGYGAIEVDEARRAELMSAGVIRTSPQQPTAQRLFKLQSEFALLIDEYAPNVVALERVFFTANATTAIGVAQAAGLMMAAGVAIGAEVVEYTPNQVKIAVTGWGAAPKEQVQRMVQMLLRLPEKLKPADTADAVAVALCHLAHNGPGRIEANVANDKASDNANDKASNKARSQR